MDPVEMHRVLDIRVFQNCSDVCSGCLVVIEDMAKLRCINKLGIKREIFLLSQLRKEIQTFLGLFRDLLVGALPRHDPETRSAKIGVELHTLRFLRGSILLSQEVEQSLMFRDVHAFVTPRSASTSARHAGKARSVAFGPAASRKSSYKRNLANTEDAGRY